MPLLDQKNNYTLDDIDKEIARRRKSIDDEIGRRGLAIPRQATERTVGGTLKDIAITGAKGIVGAGEAAVGLADIPTLGRVGGGMEKYLGYDPAKTHEALSEYYSPAQKAAFKKVEEAKGFFGTTKEMLKHPSTIGHAVVESAPLMLGGAAIARRLLASGALKMTPAWNRIIASATGEGLVSAGATAEGIRQQTEDGYLTPKQAAIAPLSGAGTALFAIVGGRVAQKFGIIDPDVFLAGGSNVTSVGIIKRIIGGGISEGAFEELPQSMQEQVWLNAATDKPLLEDVGEAGATGMLTGFAMGAGFNIFTGKPIKKGEADDTLLPTEATNLINAIDKFMVTGEIGVTGQPFTPDLAIAVIKQGYDDNILTDKDLEEFGERYPELKNGIIGGKISSEITQEIQAAEKPISARGVLGAEDVTAKELLTGKREKALTSEELIAERTKEVSPVEPAPIEPKTDVVSEPVVEKPIIPDFKNTGEAKAFGKKATPEQIAELKQLRQEALDEYEVLEKADINKAMVAATKGQLYREALESAEKPTKKVALEKEPEVMAEEDLPAFFKEPEKAEVGKDVHDYSSTQVNLPKESAKIIKDLSRKIPDEEIYIEKDDDSYGREDKPHITVRYGLETSDIKDIEPAFKDIAPIKVKFGKVSIFEGDDYDVIKVDVESSDLHEANKKVGETVKLPGETFKEYKPHATIAYVKKGEGKKYIGDKSLEGQEAIIDSIFLAAKDGKMHEVKLKPPTPKPPEAKPPEAITDEVKGEGIVAPTPKESLNATLKKHGYISEKTDKPGRKNILKGKDIVLEDVTSEEVWKWVKAKVEKEKAEVAPEKVTLSQELKTLTDKLAKKGKRYKDTGDFDSILGGETFTPETRRLVNEIRFILEEDASLIKNIPKELGAFFESYPTIQDKVEKVEVETTPEGEEITKYTEGQRKVFAQYEGKIRVAKRLGDTKEAERLRRELNKLKAKPIEKPADVKARLIENIKSEKGESALINDLSILGADAIRKGHDSFKAFSAQMKIVLSEVWDKIKHLMRQAYDAAKTVLKSERGAIGGIKAIGAPTGQLVKAQEMLAEGKSEKEVWKETGWLKGAEKEETWKFEIDDSGAKIKIEGFKQYKDQKDIKEGTLSEVLDHPELFKAYPELKDITVATSRDTKSSYSDAVKHISLAEGILDTKRIDTIEHHLADAKNALLRSEEIGRKNFEKYPDEYKGKTVEDAIKEQDDFIKKEIKDYEHQLTSGDIYLPSELQSIKETLLHEVSHAIQEIENFARGGSPEKIAELEHLKKTGFSSREDMVVALKELRKKYNVVYGKWHQKAFEEKRYKGQTDETRKLLHEWQRIESKIKGLKEYKYDSEEAFKSYLNLAGEIEARDTAARAKLTPKQRREQMPYESEDIPRADWIITDGEGTSFSIEESKQFATKPTLDYKELIREYQKAYTTLPPVEKAPPKVPSAYEKGKDDWFGNKDWAEVQHAVERGKLQDDIRDTVSVKKNTFGKKIFDQRSRDVDAAIHLYLDLKRNPAHRTEYYKDLPAEWKKIVDKIDLVEFNPKLKAIADYIRTEGDKTGKMALEADVIHNQIENHVNRVWKKRAGISERSYTDALQKFKTKSRHAKHRTFDTILEGLALKDKSGKHIFDLQIRGATSNLQTLKDEISRVIEDKKLITEMRKTKTEDGDPLLSTHRINDTYIKIEHPNFKVWEFATGIDLVEKTIDKATGLAIGDSIRAKDRGNIGKIIAITDKGIDVHFVNKKEGTEKTISFKKDAIGKLEQPLIKVTPKGINFFITNEGTVLEKRELYAPKKIARDLNKILGVSRLKGVRILGVPAIDILTKYNAIFKSWILVTSFFHHQAFLRSYELPSQHKTLAEWNPSEAYKMGKKAIENMVPEIELLVRNGLTMFKMQDWEESILRREDTIFGKILDRNTTSKAIKDKINELRERQANFLFGNFGAALKTQAALIELRNMTRKHPEMDVQERAKMVARLINDDFGGLHLGRMGRDPTIQHIMRLLLLAPDWTESNVRTMVKAFKSPGGPKETAMYRRFWTSTITKGLSAIFVANILMAALDDDDFEERYKKSWKAGHFRWLDIDITPIYKMFGGKSEARKYFSLFGHFRDPLKFIRHPIRSLHHKGSVVYGTFHEAMSGTDWKGQKFTTLQELIGIDDKGVYLTTTKKHRAGDPKGGKLAGKLVTYGGKGPISLEQMPSYMVSQLIGIQPIQIQNLIAMLTGEVAAFDGIARSLGMHTGTTYPTTKSIREDFIEEYINLREGRKSAVNLQKKVRKYNLKHKGNEIIKWPNIVEGAKKRQDAKKAKKYRR